MKAILISTLLLFSFVAKSMEVEINMIPEFHDFLKEQAIENSWGVFIPKKTTPNSTEHLNIQFSFENGEIGLDWVLLSPVNIRDRADFEKFASSNGFEFELITGANGVKYLRSEQLGIKQFCGKILTEFYGLESDEKIDFYSGGYGDPEAQ